MSSVKKTLFHIFLAAAVFAAPSSGICAEGILLYRSEIEVRKDSSLLITETIKVQSEGHAIKRGIYRDFPTDYKDGYGHKYNVRFHLEQVLRDGSREDYHIKRYGNGVRIYVGNKSRYLKPGVYTYTLKYETDRQIGFFKDHDELYFNAIGHGWSFPIREGEAVVSLPPAISSSAVKYDGFTGKQGSRSKNFAAYIDGAGRVVFKVSRVLAPFEGLTVVVSWPKNFVKKPSIAARVKFFLSDNLSSLIGLFGLAFLFFYYYSVWKRIGKDPEKGTIIPLFRPPEKLSPAAVRYIMQRGGDNEGFAAAVISLAAKGVLTIRQLGGVFTLLKNNAPLTNLSPEEVVLFSNLFLEGDEIELKNKNHKIISRTLDRMKSSLDRKHRKVHFLLNRSQAGIGILLAFTTAGFMWGVESFNMEALVTPVNLGLLAVTAVVIAVFYELLEAPTPRGRALMDKIEGFKMYLGTAEGEQLDKLHPPEKTPELFEKYLPYAIALGVENRWSQKFKDILAEAESENGSGGPVWYQSFSNSGYLALSSSLGSSLSSAIASASVAPGSSSGGGGFSGGGGGGGGGGGW